MSLLVTGMSATALDLAPRWMGVGVLHSADASAVRRALFAATEGRPPTLLILFASADLDLHAIAGAIGADLPPDVAVVGCTTAGEISDAGPRDDSVVMVALGGPDFTVATRLATDVSPRLRAAGAEAARAISDVADRPYSLLMLLTDGLSGDQQEIVRGAYAVTGALVPLVGGCAGDARRMEQTFVIYNGQVISDAIVGIAIGSSAPFSLGVGHGWRRVGQPMLVTGSVGNVVLTLDEEPALDVYLRALNAPAEIATDLEAFRAFAMRHPLGMSRRSGEEVRLVADADLEARSLKCIAQVPQGGIAWIMAGDTNSVLAGTEIACAEALLGLEGRTPLGLIAFDCIARRGVLGDDETVREVELIRSAAAGAAVAGFYTYGEIARDRGTGGFHNQTLVVLALS